VKDEQISSAEMKRSGIQRALGRAFAFLGLALLGNMMLPAGSAAEIYDIGPGKQYERLEDFNWDRLRPGDTVRIHWKKEPYAEKLVIRRSGTPRMPIVIKGVPGPSRELPVIDGRRAKHFQDMMEPLHARRGLIVVGDDAPADHIVIEGLEIRNANNAEKFEWGGKQIGYADNAAGIFLHKGINVRIRGCKIHSCCMGVLTSYYPDVDDLSLTGNFIYDNGDFRGDRWGHNVYLCAGKTLVAFNRFGELRSDGNNIKDRSGETIIRYNWIEGGKSRQIDMVESEKYQRADAFVYGNVIVQGRNVLNPKMILFGGDVGGSRGGTLHFFNNTVHAASGKLDAFLVLNTINCIAVLQNNYMLGGTTIWAGKGRVTGANNLFPHGSNTLGFENTLFGGHEQKVGVGVIPYFPRPGSLLVDRGTSDVPKKVEYMPLPITGGKKRPVDGRMDIGAYELSKSN
jgi:hypothetical protein